MLKTFCHSSRRQRTLATIGVVGSAIAISVPVTTLHAQGTVFSGTTTGNATVQPAGPRTGTNGTNFFNIEGSSNNANASFGVLDFATSAFNLGSQAVSGVENNTLTLSLVESNSAFTAPGNLEFYLTTNNAVGIVTGTSPLRYQNPALSDPPNGIDSQLGTLASGNTNQIFDLGSGVFSSTGTANTGTKDTYTLTLSAAALQVFLSDIGSSSGNVRLVVAGTTATTAATFAGATNATVANRPLLAFTPIFSTANNLYWQGGTGTWTATGGTAFNPNNSNSGTTAWNNDGAHRAYFSATPAGVVSVGPGIAAAGIQFDVDGYTLNAASGGGNITLSNAASIQVAAAATATVNVPLGGTVGLTKSGAGTLILGGTNTYSGTTTISAGTLQVSADAPLGAAGTPLALAGGTLASGLTSGNLSLARGVTGGGGLGAAGGSTLTFTGVVNAGALTLPGGGTLALANGDGTLANGSSNAFTSLTFQTGGASVTTQNSGTSNGLGIINAGGFVAAQTSGSVTVAANMFVTGTVGVNVANAGATLRLPGGILGAAVLAKTGAGTLVLGGDNSGLTGTGTTPASVRQGTAGNSPAAGGIISVTATSGSNPLGVAQYQANGGTLRNDSGSALVLASTVSMSIGAQDSTATPGGLVFAGANPITVNGGVSLFKASSATTSYQHLITVNTPTTFTGMFTASTGTGNSTGLTIAGSSTLTLSGAAGANLFVEPMTIATSGTGSGVILGKDGAFGANAAITINSGATLTINTGVTTGTTDAINNAAVLAFNAVAGTFGKLVLTLADQETVGGLYLAVGHGSLAAGLQPAGTYGPTGSGADHIDDTLFGGQGKIMNLATVPEPSTTAALILALLSTLGWLSFRRRTA